MRKRYISPKTTITLVNIPAVCTRISVGTTDNTGNPNPGGGGPGTGGDNEDVGAKQFTYNVWEDEL